MFVTESKIRMYKNVTSQSKHNESSVYPISTARHLLSGASHKQLLENIRKIVAMEELYYGELYLALIYEYASYVQSQPDVGSSYNQFALNTSLKRAYVVLQQYLSQRTKSAGDAGRPYNDELMCFTVFSCALLYEVGMLVTDRSIFLTEEDGDIQRHWMPLEQPLSECGNYFKIRYIQQLPREYGRKITPIIATNLMPPDGMRWIVTYPELHFIWLNALTSFNEAFGVFDMELHIHHKDINSIYLGDLPVDVTDILYKSVNERFWKWLKDGIKNKKISVNKIDSAVHVTTRGVMLETPKIFKEFAKSQPNTKVALSASSHNYMGLIQMSGGDSLYKQLFGAKKSTLSAGGFYSQQSTLTAGEKTGGIQSKKGMIIPKKMLPGITNKLSDSVMMPTIKQAIDSYATHLKNVKISLSKFDAGRK